MMRLSLCMIVKNEAENLPRCLESVKSAVDEIIVLDTGSTDGTIAIAQSYGAQVSRFEWCHDFAVARNAALKQVTSDWVLVLDADEALAPSIISLLRQLIQRQDALVINLIRHEIGAAQSPYSLVSRLFRRHPQLQFSRPYHAMIDDSVAALLQQEPHWQVINCADVAILHYGYQPGAITSRNKLQTARATMESYWKAHPHDAYVCSKLGALYVQMGEFEPGIELLKRGLQASESSQDCSQTHPNAAILYELYYHLGIAYSQIQNDSLAEQHYQSATQQPILESLKLGAYTNLGNLLKAKGDLQQASTLYRTCLAIDPDFAIGHYNLGMALKAQGQLEAAISHYQTAIRLDPTYAEAYQNLGVALLKQGQVAASLQAFRQAIERHQQRNPAEAERLRQGLAEMGFRL